MSLEFIEEMSTDENMIDKILCSHLDNMVAESTESMNIEALHDLVNKKLSLDMSVKSFIARMRFLFIVHHKLLYRQRLV